MHARNSGITACNSEGLRRTTNHTVENTLRNAAMVYPDQSPDFLLPAQEGMTANEHSGAICTNSVPVSAHGVNSL